MSRLMLRGAGCIVASAALLALPIAAGAGNNQAAVKSVKTAQPVKIIAIGGAPSDPFFGGVIKGMKDAAKATGVSFTYLGPQNYNNLGPDLARLEETALAQRPSAAVVLNTLPSAQSPGIKAMVKAGIPVIEFNAGGTVYKSDGALMFVGSDEILAGLTAGKKLAASGARSVICVNTAPGTLPLEQRCGGVVKAMKAAGGTAKELELPITTFADPTAVTQAIKGTLLSDPKIDGVITVGANVTDWAVDAVKQAGKTGKVKIATFDINLSNLKRIQAGTQVFAIDQQPYLQGFYSVLLAAQYVKYGLLPAGGWIKTGPLLITKTNVAQILATFKLGIRV